jgi:hypothetical protein
MSKESYGWLTQVAKTVMGIVAVVIGGRAYSRRDKGSKENKENSTADAKSRAAEKQEA